MEVTDDEKSLKVSQNYMTNNLEQKVNVFVTVDNIRKCLLRKLFLLYSDTIFLKYKSVHCSEIVVALRYDSKTDIYEQ